MAKQRFYVVWEGIQPGIYHSWAECQQQTDGFDRAKFKAYDSLEAAELAYREGWKKHWGQKQKQKQKQREAARSPAVGGSLGEIDYNSISVDVGTWGNPGPIEYKGVDTGTGDVIFHVKPEGHGTNNLGEFIAIVHALAYLKQQGSNKTVYSDSLTAQKWVRDKRVASTLVRDESTQKVWELTDRALKWLHTNTYPNKVLKWQTDRWGENKADFGRK